MHALLLAALLPALGVASAAAPAGAPEAPAAATASTEDADLRAAQARAWAGDSAAALDLLAPWVARRSRQAVLDDATYRGWQGRLGDAVGRLDAWLGTHPDDVEAKLLRAKLRSWTGDLAAARADYRRILETSPANGEARLGLARLAVWQGDPDGARQELLRLEPGPRGSDEAQLLAAQVEAARGELRAARTRLRALAAGGPSSRPAREALADLAEQAGPWMEGRFAHTETSEGLRTDDPILKLRLPLLDGRVDLSGDWRSLSFQGAARRPSVFGVEVSQPVGPFLQASAGLQSARLRDHSPRPAWSAALCARAAPGLSLRVAAGRSLLDVTPQAADGRVAIDTQEAGLDWAFGDGRWLAGLAAGRGDLTAEGSPASSRWSLFGTLSRRFTIASAAPVELRAGLLSRAFGYSATLPLGFFNPERYQFHGLTAGATVRLGRVLSAWAEGQGGWQRVDTGGWRLAWGHLLGAAWSPLGDRATLTASWSSSEAGLTAATATDPDSYREQTVQVALRIRG